MSAHANDYLFFERDLRLGMQNHQNDLFQEIDQISEDRLLNTNPEELADYFTAKFILDPPTLFEDKIKVSRESIKLNVRSDFPGFEYDRSDAVRVDGTRLTYHIPFEGDADLFKFQASSFTLNPPHGKIVGKELQIVYERTEIDSEGMKTQLERDLANIKKHLESVVSDVSSFNAKLRGIALVRINGKREKLIREQTAVTNLGFPMLQRENAPTTFAVPAKRKYLPLPDMKLEKVQQLEPILDLTTYDDILKIIQNMTLVFERSPSAFRVMDEEAFRQHFLVQLNGQYEGQATGETFNCDGRTDILIRVGGKNIFIAECKFWHGSKSLNDAIDQVLGYATWRDTKIAILVFNRTKKFSSVLEKIPEVLRNHSNYVCDLPFNSDSGFRATFRHKDDIERELTLTVLAFEVPGD